jgi:hypothetical protein
MFHNIKLLLKKLPIAGVNKLPIHLLEVEIKIKNLTSGPKINKRPLQHSQTDVHMDRY